ncbi:SGNH/GDSL hydrolase family protein, partial [Candidatus Saccharibacteria bacterium]|nr:SGNH/GDSL hydrolase family protein [Candidatus Saccharibacteria bacterium]
SLDVSAQNTPQTWLDLNQSPNLEESWSIPPDQFNISVQQGYKPTCEDTTMLTRLFSVGLPLWRQTIDRCWYSTSLGLLARTDNNLVANNNLIAGPISNIGAYLRPTPHEGTFLEIKTSGSSTSNYVRFHYGSGLTTTSGLFGTVSHTLSETGSLTLKTSSGSNVALPAGQGINYSENGKWATGVTVNYAMFRINLATKQILNFGAPMQHGTGFNPFMALSITDDGRYAVASVTAPVGSQWMRVYDLNDCKDTEHAYLSLSHANCTYRDLTDLLKTNVPGFNRFTMAEFGGDESLVFYHYSAGSSGRYTRYVMRAPNAKPRARNYVALGDSFASGEGAYSYFKGTDEGNSLNNCHLSRRSYPYLIGEQLQLDSYHSVACSGARTKNAIGPEIIDISLTNPNRTNQYLGDDAVASNELGKWMPGFNIQLNNFNNSNPDVVTISMLGNDIGFDGMIKRCLEPDTCYNSYEDRLEILRSVYGKFGMLTNLYEKIKSSTQPDAKIYIIGYPNIGKSNGDCAINVRLNSDELEFASLLMERLNYVTQQAAFYAGVKYVDIKDSLNGYGFCEGAEYPAMNGLTAGDDIASVIGNESFHPNAKGHRLFAETIRSQTSDFSVAMPAPNKLISGPSQETDLLFLNKLSTGREVRELNYDDTISNDVVYRENWWDITYSSIKQFFKPTSLVKIVLLSDPTELASVTADNKGAVRSAVNIPASVSTGFHSLHLYGEDLAGNKIDVYKVIYVAHSESDKNGDGQADSSQPCGIFETSGQDIDKDGKDDACDDIIGLAPLQQPAISSNVLAKSEGTVPEEPSLQDISSEAPASTPSIQTGSVLSANITSDSDAYLSSNDAVEDSTAITSMADTSLKNSPYNYPVFIAGLAGAIVLTLLYRLGYAKR